MKHNVYTDERCSVEIQEGECMILQKAHLGLDEAICYRGYMDDFDASILCIQDWLTSEPPEGLVFAADDQGKWIAALRGMGIDPLVLSAASGRA